MCGIEPSYYGTHAPKEHAITSTPEYFSGQQFVHESNRHVIMHMIARNWRLDHQELDKKMSWCCLFSGDRAQQG